MCNDLKCYNFYSNSIALSLVGKLTQYDMIVTEVSNAFYFFSKVVAALVALRESGDLSKEEKLNSSIHSSEIGQ